MTHIEVEVLFGQQVREARERRGWSQEALTRHLRELAGVELNQPAIARLERGERVTRLKEAAALAQLLGIDLQPYSAGVPSLTAEEYEKVRAERSHLRKREADADARLRDLQHRLLEEQHSLEREVELIREDRRRLDRAINLYEQRQAG